MSIDNGRLTILHVSDVHATDDGLLYDTIDGIGRLELVGSYARSAGITPEAVIVTGDLAQRGHTSVYRDLERALHRLEDAVNAPVLTVLGNHDDRDAARVLSGHAESHYRVVELGPLRIVLLDSSTGSIDAEQLDWLRDTVSRPYGQGTVVALHHAPLGSPLPTLAKSGLRNPRELTAALAGSDTRIVLAGHFHHPMAAVVDGLQVSVGPSLAYHQVMNAGPDAVSGHDSAMFSLVHLTDGGVSTTSVSMSTPEPLFTAPSARARAHSSSILSS
jgi:Icc protein